MTSSLQQTGLQFLTLDQAAKFVPFSKVTLRRAIRARRLAACKPNGKFGKILIRPVDLMQYVESSRRSAVTDNRT